MIPQLIVALQLFSPVDPAPIASIHEERIARLAREQGADSVEVRGARRDLGLFWLRNARPGEAERWLRMAAADPAVLPFLGESIAAQDRNAEAEAVFRQCRAKAICASRLAQYAEERGDSTAAVGLYREAVKAEGTGGRHNDLALALRNAGKARESEAEFREALRLQEKEFGAAHPETASTRNNLASLLLSEGRLAEAETTQRRAASDLEAGLGPWHARTGLAMSNLADILRERGREAEARAFYRRALSIFEASLPAGHPWIAEAAASASAPRK